MVESREDERGIADMDALRNSERIERLVSLGRRAAAGDTEARKAIVLLRESDCPYRRLSALLTVHGSRDTAMLLAALHDASRTVRYRAAALLTAMGSDAECLAALGEMHDPSLRKTLLMRLARRRRFDVNDNFLSAREDIPLGLHLFGSEAHVQARLDDIAPLIDLSPAARRYPTLVLRWFDAQFATKGRFDRRLHGLLAPLLPHLAQRAPGRTLETMRLLVGDGCGLAVEWMFHLALPTTLRHHPRETFDLLRHIWTRSPHASPPGIFGLVRFDKVAARLGAERLAFLLRNAWSRLSDGRRGQRWFLRLSNADRRAVLEAFADPTTSCRDYGAFLLAHLPRDTEEQRQRREAAYQRWTTAARDGNGRIAVDAMMMLPRDLREREARRHLEELPYLRTHLEMRLAYARGLGFRDAREALDELLRHPEGDRRAAAQATLLRTLRHDREAMGDALDHLTQRRFEQDPVRCAMLSTLSQLPLGCFDEAHLGALGEALQHALDAADLSTATAAAMQNLVVRLFRVDGAWASGWLVKLLEVRGQISTYGLAAGLTARDVEALAPVIEVLVARWCNKERAGALLLLAGSLETRLARLPRLCEALETMARELPFVGVAAEALRLLARHDRPRFRRLVPQLLAADESYTLIAEVAEYVSWRRQDLLHELLADRPTTGRFATGRLHHVWDFDAGFHRWSAAQQRSYAEQLESLIADPSQSTATLSFALSRRVKLAFAPAEPIVALAADARPVVRELAVRALPYLDGGEGLMALLECLGDDRSRWAIYALRKALASLAPDDVVDKLRAAPRQKVTVAKEVVRLLGDLGGDTAYDELLVLSREELHRDVRVALLRALWSFLHRDETWALLEEAAADEDWVIAAKAGEVPTSQLSDEAEGRVCELLTRLLRRSEPQLRRVVFDRLSFLPLRDGERRIARQLLEHLGVDDVQEAVYALNALLRRLLTTEVDELVARLESLAPRRRHLARFVDILVAQTSPYAPAQVRRTCRLLGEALARDGRTHPLALRLLAQVVETDELATLLEAAAERRLLHYDGMLVATSVASGCLRPGVLEAALRDHPSAQLRRVALAALEADAGRHGWTAARQALLERYRKDPEDAVAGRATFVFPPNGRRPKQRR